MRRADQLLLSLLAVATAVLLPAVTWQVQPARADAADWVWPTSGSSAAPVVARRFSPPAARWGAGHRGVDLVAGAGSRVHAAGGGSVAFAGLVAGRGVVVIAHGDGTRTTYEPVLPVVAAGGTVATGGHIGQLAAAGGHCLPATCLHWGRLRGEEYLDPLAVLGRARPVRLLPVWAATPAAVARGPTVIDAGGVGTSSAVDAPRRNRGTGASRRADDERPGWSLVAGGDREQTYSWALAAAVVLGLSGPVRRRVPRVLGYPMGSASSDDRTPGRASARRS